MRRRNRVLLSLLMCVIAMCYLSYNYLQSSFSREIVSPTTTVPSNVNTRSDVQQGSIRICSQRERKSHIQKMCQTLDVLRTPQRKEFIVDERHKVAYCSIPKVASSTWNRLMMMSQMPNRNVTKSFKTSHKKHILRDVYGLRFERNVTRLQNYTKFLVVRNPYTRLISAYRDKIASERDKNAPFFKLRKILKSFETGRKTEEEPVKLETFLMHVLFSSRAPSHLRFNQHWVPYLALCNPCAVDYDVILRTETMTHDSAPVLEKLGFTMQDLTRQTKNVDPAYRTKSNNTTASLTSFSEHLGKKVAIKRSHVELLQQRYGLEELLFGYTLDKTTGVTGCAIDTLNSGKCC